MGAGCGRHRIGCLRGWARRRPSTAGMVRSLHASEFLVQPRDCAFAFLDGRLGLLQLTEQEPNCDVLFADGGLEVGGCAHLTAFRRSGMAYMRGRCGLWHPATTCWLPIELIEWAWRRWQKQQSTMTKRSRSVQIRAVPNAKAVIESPGGRPPPKRLPAAPTSRS